ncbi:MAG: beta-N-acetylhexosaminidase [Deltaproteobacteria bacterium]|nr:MAG: beta-N-acetylhexosaminidase [Deltaproteobacteria bacterium]
MGALAIRDRFIVGFAGTSVPAELARFVRSGAAAGAVIFARNIESTAQVVELTRELRALWPADGPAPLLAVDQEGGLVQRLKPPRCPEFTPLPPMREAARLGPDGLRRLGAQAGRELAAAGFNLDFAPVLDVDTNPANPIIGSRAFAATPEGVIAGALAFAAGLEDAGVLPCGKHFPGHGDTDVDSHLALPVLRHDRARLEAVELAPFAAAVAAGMPLMMTAHIVYAALDAELPATLSPRVVPELLRGALGFDGAVVSDDLEMKAIAGRFGAEDVARGVLAADVDLLLVCHEVALAEELAAALAHATTPRAEARACARVAALRRRARDHAAVTAGWT